MLFLGSHSTPQAPEIVILVIGLLVHACCVRGDIITPSSTQERYKGTNEVIPCDEVYSVTNSANGTVMSLGYPGPYPQKRVCKVVLKGDDRHRVLLTFTDFYLFHPLGRKHRKDISCDKLDSLRIYDGGSERGKMLGEYCGALHPPPIMSSGPDLTISLISYSGNFGPDVVGFNATYSFVGDYAIKSGTQLNKNCTFEYASSKRKEGNVTTPNPGGPYPRNTNCTYVFKGNIPERILLRFHKFDLEGIEPCSAKSGSDFLEFSSLPGFDPFPARRCGRFVPQEVVSEGPYFIMHFSSNDRLGGLGFSASYSFLTEDKLPRWVLDRSGCLSLTFVVARCSVVVSYILWTSLLHFLLK